MKTMKSSLKHGTENAARQNGNQLKKCTLLLRKSLMNVGMPLYINAHLNVLTEDFGHPGGMML